MKEKQKTHDAIPVGASGGAGGEGLDAERQQLNDLLAAGDAAIEAALSGDSAAFLAANRQRGGE